MTLNQLLISNMLLDDLLLVASCAANSYKATNTSDVVRLCAACAGRWGMVHCNSRYRHALTAHSCQTSTITPQKARNLGVLVGDNYGLLLYHISKIG